MGSRRRRFTTRVVAAGRHEGSIHVGGRRFYRFYGLLQFMQLYLVRHVYGGEPEESTLADIIGLLQNSIEKEIDALIALTANGSSDRKMRAFSGQVSKGYVAFKTKVDWLASRRLLSPRSARVLDELRIIRNSMTHRKPSDKRLKLTYFNEPLMTGKTVKKLLGDADEVRIELLRQTKGTVDWPLHPLGYVKPGQVEGLLETAAMTGEIKAAYENVWIHLEQEVLLRRMENAELVAAGDARKDARA